MTLRAVIIMALGMVVAITATPLGHWLESTMVSHVLVELPLLVVAGIIFALPLKPVSQPLLNWVNRGGICGLITASFLLAFWMLPRWLDTSLGDPWVASAKYGSMVLTGMILALSWPSAHVITRAVVKIEFLTMFFRLGWLYLISPERLCNNYLLTDQIWLGRGFLLVGLALTITWAYPILFGNAVLEQQLTERKLSID
jgi:hypothetical protein